MGDTVAVALLERIAVSKGIFCRPAEVTWTELCSPTPVRGAGGAGGAGLCRW